MVQRLMITMDREILVSALVFSTIY